MIRPGYESLVSELSERLPSGVELVSVEAPSGRGACCLVVDHAGHAVIEAEISWAQRDRPGGSGMAVALGRVVRERLAQAEEQAAMEEAC